MPRAAEESTLILRTATRIATPVILVVSLYFLLRGHDAPGGGFIAALVAGAAVVLRYLAFGPEGIRRLVPVSAEAVLATGLLVALAVGLVPLVVGGAFLEGAIWQTTLPVVGEVKATASLIFDVGVYLVVVGVVVTVIRVLGVDR